MARLLAFALLAATVSAGTLAPAARITPQRRHERGILFAARAKPPLAEEKRFNYARVADSALAALGAAGSIALVCALEGPLGMKLYAPPLAPCAMIIFAGQQPPPFRNLFLGTAGPLLAASAVKGFGGGAAAGRSVATGLSMLWFKTSASFFPPAAAFSVVLVDSLPPLSKEWLTRGGIANFVPAAVGTSTLYGMSFALASLRSQVRVCLAMRQMRGGMPMDQLKATFKRYDTSGDGMLDPEELKLALRATMGIDFTIETCTCVKAPKTCGAALCALSCRREPRKRFY